MPPEANALPIEPRRLPNRTSLVTRCIILHNQSRSDSKSPFGIMHTSFWCTDEPKGKFEGVCHRILAIPQRLYDFYYNAALQPKGVIIGDMDNNQQEVEVAEVFFFVFI